MKKFSKTLVTLLAAVSIVPVSGVTQSAQTVAAVQNEQTQGQRLVSLGASLSAQQAQETLQILGASDVPQSNITYVDGETVNYYLNDGSNANTIVYSSAYIQEMQPGYGVQVQILTPQNILQVSSTTYQNAAITAGIQDANLRIATVEPVTGEGALAGVYAMLEDQGQALNQEDIQVAQQEIQVINNIQNNTQITNNQINQIFADMKIYINQLNQSDEDITDEDIEAFVRELAAQNGITDETAITQMIDYAKQFANTEAAQNPETTDQLEQSIQESWTDTLTGLEGSLSPEEILEQERPDYSDQEVYHPIIQAFSDMFYQLVEQQQRIDNLYSHTFIFEAMTPDLSAEEKTALNEVRALMYQYSAYQEEQPGATKEQWLTNIQTAESRRLTDPVLAEIVQRIANASGLAPEVFNYNEMYQEGSIIEFFIRWETYTHVSMMDQYSFDVETGEISKLNVASAEYEPVATTTFDFEAMYGVPVENNYPETAIPADYTIPGYEPVEEEVSSESSETSSEEEVLSDESSLESSNEEAPVEEAPSESSSVEESMPEGESQPNEEEANDASVNSTDGTE